MPADDRRSWRRTRRAGWPKAISWSRDLGLATVGVAFRMNLWVASPRTSRNDAARCRHCRRVFGRAAAGGGPLN